MKRNQRKPFFDTVEPGVFIPRQEVDAEVYSFTELGMIVVINNRYTGLVYGNQVYADYEKGQKLKAYIKCVRDDGKIDVSLQPDQDMHVFSSANKIMEHLGRAGGKSGFNDKSSPEAIKNEFQISKKVFKQALGSLYKQGKIIISDKGIELVKTPGHERKT